MIKISSNINKKGITEDIAARFIADRLKIARRRNHFTLEKMSSLLGITRKQLQNYESAKSNLTVIRLWEISKLLNIELAFFIEDLSCGAPFADKEDLNLLVKLHSQKNKQAKQALINILNEL